MKPGDKVMIKKCLEWIPGTIIELTITGAWVEIRPKLSVWRLRKSIRVAGE